MSIAKAALLLYLFLGDCDWLPEDCPRDHLVAGWGGEGAGVAVELVQALGE